jgi:replicative DNA helicase
MANNELTADPQHLEQCICKGLREQKDFVVLVKDVFEKEYFINPELRDIFEQTKVYFNQYKEIPDLTILLNNIPADRREAAQEFLTDLERTDLDINRHYDWLKDQTDAYLKDKAIKFAINDAVDIIEAGESSHEVRKLVDDALCKTIHKDIGMNYFGDLHERLPRMFSDDTQRLRTYFPIFDEYVNGGFPPKTLSVFVAKIHGFKSNVMANMIARQVLNGKNIALASLEMSEDMFAQRFDGIYSMLDINRFYFNEQLKQQLMRRLIDLRNLPSRGNLYIKSFPTGKANVDDFRAWVRELQMRGVTLDGFFFDYLNLMASVEVSKAQGTYAPVKSVAEETRAMGFEFDIPMISVSQLNREGTFMSFADVDFNSIAESMGVPATADFMMIMGANSDGMVYNNEVHYKIVKNRLGGRVGEMDKFFYDARSLKMYCSSELNTWMEDVQISGDDREPYESREDVSHDTGTRRLRD